MRQELNRMLEEARGQERAWSRKMAKEPWNKHAEEQSAKWIRAVTQLVAAKHTLDTRSLL